MLNIIENIDPINYIIQDVLSKISGEELTPRNNFIVRDGYALDVLESRKNNYRLKIRTTNLQDLCNIIIDKNGFVIRYSPQFYIVNNGIELSTNLFSSKFTLEDLESTFNNNTDMFGLGVEFNYSNMVDTIIISRRVHSEFMRKIAI